MTNEREQSQQITSQESPLTPEQQEKEQQAPLISQSEIQFTDQPLLPILKFKAIQHQNKLDVLEEKQAVLKDKILHNQEKISKLASRAGKLEDVNQLLKAFSSVPLVQTMIAQNEKKISCIREKKIPAHMDKIQAHQTKMAKLKKRQSVVKHKLDRCMALNQVLRSFAIHDTKERRQTFASAMEKLNHSTCICMLDKYLQMQIKLSALNETYQTASAVDKLHMQEKMSDIKSKMEKLENKMSKIKAAHFINQDATTVDQVIDVTKNAVDTEMAAETPSVAAVAENICTNAASIAADKSQEQITASTATEELHGKEHYIPEIPPLSKEAFDQVQISEMIALDGLDYDDFMKLYYTFFEDNVEKLSAHQDSLKDLQDPQLHNMADRAKNGEDVRQELAMALIGRNPPTEVEFLVYKGEIHYQSAEEFCEHFENMPSPFSDYMDFDSSEVYAYTMHFEYGENTVTATCGDMSCEISYTDIGAEIFKAVKHQYENQPSPLHDEFLQSGSSQCNMSYIDSILPENRYSAFCTIEQAAGIFKHLENKTIDFAARSASNNVVQFQVDSKDAELLKDIVKEEAQKIAVGMSEQEKAKFLDHSGFLKPEKYAAVDIALKDILIEELQSRKQALMSVEASGEVYYFKVDESSIDDILAAANSEKPMMKLMEMGEQISDIEYAEIQQSESFTYSVEIDLNNDTAKIYMVNEGKGGISEADRTDDNIRFDTLKISDYGRKQTTPDISEHIPEPSPQYYGDEMQIPEPPPEYFEQLEPPPEYFEQQNSGQPISHEQQSEKKDTPERPYIIPLKTEQQLENLKQSEIPYTLKRKNNELYAFFSHKDKDAALKCINGEQAKSMKLS